MENGNQANETRPREEGGGYLGAEQVKALQILLQGVQVGQKRGAYDLGEAEILSKAVKQFVAPKNETQQAPTEATTTTTTQSTLNQNEDDEPRVI
jgi:hypothetical protein